MTHFKLHFDFNHIKDYHEHKLVLLIRGKKYTLNLHDESSLRKAANENHAVGAIVNRGTTGLTHHVEIPHSHFNKRSLTRIQVIADQNETDGRKNLPVLHHVSYMVHRDVHISHMKNMVQKHGRIKANSLITYGINEIPENLHINYLIDQYHVQGPQDIALHLAGMHPMTMSNKPETHLAMQSEHVFPTHKTDPDSINQVNNINYLSRSLQSQGPATTTSGFARIKQSLHPVTQEPLQYEYDLGPSKTGDPVMVYDLTDETSQWLAPAASQPVQSSRNDSEFQNQTWSANQGLSSFDIANQEDQEQIKVLENFSAGSTPNWQVSPNTSTHGMSVYQSTISIDSNNNFSVEVLNKYLRIVGAYVQFYSDTEMTEPITNLKGWKEQAIPSTFETDSKKYIKIVPNVNTIMGIPMPTENTELGFVWPEEAKSAKLMFGGVGTYNYDEHIVWPGFIETGIFQFGIPIFFMAAGAAVTSTKWYKDFIEETDNIAVAAALAFTGGSVAFGSYAAIKGLQRALFTFGDIIAGLLVTKGFEKLSEYILTKIAASEMAEAVPYVGWALRIASMSLNASEIAVSLGEVLSSPAVIDVNIKREMTFNFTLHPDPKHGEPNQPYTAIWPAVGDHYKIMVNYKDGTGFEAKGNVPLTPDGGCSNQAIEKSFIVPWGGKLQVIAAVYSKTGWLCGKYQSDWMDAMPDSPESGVKNTIGNITEILVPLNQDTQYDFFQKIAYSNEKKHYWWGKSQGATPPTQTISDLSSSNVGNNIASLTGLSINKSCYVVGYGWQGSGENIPLENGTDPDTGQMYVFQNISVQQDPECRAKFPNFGFKTRPGISLDLYGGSKTEEGKLNFVLDTRDATIGYLRHIEIMDGKPIYDLDSDYSYGTFTLGDIDDMAVHPSGYVIAVNWASHRMQILKLAEQPVPDAQSPAAVVVANKGILEGLLMGPIALTISPDGKILVLESLSQRVQSFDLTGNAAPSFPGIELFSMESSAQMITSLNNKETPDDLINAFVNEGISHLFDMNQTFAMQLDQGVLTQDILDEFSDHMIYLAFEQDASGNILPDPKQTTFITVVEAGKNWKITDPSRNYTYCLNLQNNLIQVADQLDNTEVIIISKNNNWQIKDLAGSKSYYITSDVKNLSIQEYKSYFHVNPKNEKLSYLDIAIESTGYIYVLAYKGDSSQETVANTDYVLDVYTPQGDHLFRSPDHNIGNSEEMEFISAGKITIDIWRDLFSLNYEKLLGPNNRTEPSVSQWIPTPPLFDLPLSDANIFDNGDMTNIQTIFSTQVITLSNKAECSVIKKGSHWSIQDPSTAQHYDVISSLGNIYVYNLPA